MFDLKRPDKLFLLLIFVLLNLGAAFVISRFFEISWAVIAVCMVIVLAIIDLPGMIRNRKIKKAQRKEFEARKKKNQQERALHEQKREEAVRRQRRMTERNIRNQGRR